MILISSSKAIARPSSKENLTNFIRISFNRVVWMLRRDMAKWYKSIRIYAPITSSRKILDSSLKTSITRRKAEVLRY